MSDRIGGSFPDDRAERRDRGGYERSGTGRPRQQRPARPGGAGRGGRPDRSAEGSGSGFRPRQDDERDRRAVRRSDQDGGAAPRIPDSITEDDLSRDVKAELRGLPADLAATVGRYLVAAELASDPEQAYRYAQAARRIAARIGVVREVNGITAYHTGRWAEALAELRAARRLTGRDEYLPLMADSERALGRLDSALELVHSEDARRLPRAAQIELRIVESGIRRDQGLADAAVLVLQVPELTDGRLRPWSARLFYAYGDALLAAGRPEAAREAFSRAVVADEEEETDALSRLDELDGVTLEDLEDLEDEDAEDDDLTDEAIEAVEAEEGDLDDEADDDLDDEDDVTDEANEDDEDEAEDLDEDLDDEEDLEDEVEIDEEDDDSDDDEGDLTDEAEDGEDLDDEDDLTDQAEDDEGDADDEGDLTAETDGDEDDVADEDDPDEGEDLDGEGLGGRAGSIEGEARDDGARDR
jgi:tetratricopeptide (TPR) repeat protein